MHASRKTSGFEKARRQCWNMRPRVAPFAKKLHGEERFDWTRRRRRKTQGSQRTPISPWLPEKRRTMAASNKNTRMQSRLEKAARENHNLSVDYEVQAKIIREKTARLKALRLAKEAAEKKNSGA